MTSEQMEPLTDILIVNSAQDFACMNLIQFPLPDTVPWSQPSPDRRSINLQEMINDIVGYQELWMNRKNSISVKTFDKVLKQIDLRYIQNINNQEGIGTKQKGTTLEILNRLWNAEDNQFPKIVNTSINTSESKKFTETSNLYTALKKLRDITTIETNLDSRNLGLLEMESFIKEIHIILMTDVIGDKLTPPGVFSTKPRTTSYKGSLHNYPIRTENEWELEIQTLIDRYNGLIQRIKTEYLSADTRKKAVLDLFKCTAYFIFNLLSLHCFSDGNGRLSHLLAGYVLSIFTPFYSPIYNIHSNRQNTEYTDAIIKARDGSGQPEQLTALIIESNWMTWQFFLKQLGLHHSTTSKMDVVMQSLQNITSPNTFDNPNLKVEQVSTSLNTSKNRTLCNQQPIITLLPGSRSSI